MPLRFSDRSIPPTHSFNQEKIVRQRKNISCQNGMTVSSLRIVQPRARSEREPSLGRKRIFSLSSSGGEGWGEEAGLRDPIYEMGARLGNLGISPGLASTLEGVLKMPVARKRRPVSAPAILRNVAQASSPASSGGVSPPVSR